MGSTYVLYFQAHEASLLAAASNAYLLQTRNLQLAQSGS
uniref:Uncharacterized protein n=1 Tax=Arundo donax TaxID=35708 RepID=A0A0A9FIV4_ARUDO